MLLLTIISFLFVLSTFYALAVSKGEIEDYIIYVAQREEVPVQKVWDIARCESGFNPLAHNKQDPNGGSRGVFQFQDGTFYGFAKTYGIDNPDIWNPYQQANLAIYMIRDGLAHHWTCARITDHA